MDCSHSVFLVERHGNNIKDFQWAFGLNQLSLDIIGIWPREDDRARRANLRYLRTPLMLLCIIFGMTLPHMYALTRVFRELPLLVDNLTTNCAALNSIIKLFLLWYNRQVLKPVIISATHDWNSSRTYWEHRIMIKQARRARFFTISGYAIMLVCFLGFVISPFLNLSIRIVNNITDSMNGRYFPFQSYYPFDTSISPYFELMYASQLFSGCLAGFSISMPDTFFGALVFHACAQSEILELRLSKIVPTENQFLRWTLCDEQNFRSRLHKLINTHIRLIRYTEAVESSFNLLVLAHVVCISLIICCLGFGVVTSIGKENERPPLVQVVTLGGTVLNLMMHMLVYCIASEILATHSLGFTNSVYSSKWYLLPAKYSQDIIPIMVRSKWPLQLSAGKFFFLSLNSYLNILKSSFGYVSMLLAVSN